MQSVSPYHGPLEINQSGAICPTWQMDYRLYIWPQYVFRWAGHRVSLSRSEGVLLSRLFSGRTTSYFELTESLYGDREDGGADDPDGMITVTLCRLRKKIRDSPVRIEHIRFRHVLLLSKLTGTIDRISDRILREGSTED